MAIASNDLYANEKIVNDYARHLIAERAHLLEDWEPGGPSVYHALFGGADHADPLWKDAFNAARHTPEYATYLAWEMNGSMFDDSWGDVSERSGPSFMASAFANLMADKVLRLVAQDMLDDRAPG